MKAILAALAAAAASLVSAHCAYFLLQTKFASLTLTPVDTFPDFIIGSTVSADWQYIRETANHYSNGPVRVERR